MNIWSGMTTGILVMGTAVGVGATATGTFVDRLTGTTVIQAPEPAAIAQAHQQAALEAQKRAEFHQRMEKKFKKQGGESAVESASHCRYWADVYRMLAAQEKLNARRWSKRAAR